MGSNRLRDLPGMPRDRLAERVRATYGRSNDMRRCRRVLVPTIASSVAPYPTGAPRSRREPSVRLRLRPPRRVPRTRTVAIGGLAVLLAATGVALAPNASAAALPYQDPALPVAQRVND